jgi:hypothetical protein
MPADRNLASAWLANLSSPWLRDLAGACATQSGDAARVEQAGRSEAARERGRVVTSCRPHERVSADPMEGHDEH